MIRTDIHRPSVIVPEDYSFVGYVYIKEGDEYYSDRAAIAAHMERTGGKLSRHAHGGSCHICGAHAIYTARFYHKPTNEYITTGLDCAEKLDYAAASGADLFRKTVHNHLEAVAGKKKAVAILDREGLYQCWEVAESVKGTIGEPAYEERTIASMVFNLVKYGSLSEKQVGYLKVLLKKINDRPIIAAQREAEKLAVKPLPDFSGRVTIAGIVVSTKVVDSLYGSVRKMLVKHEDGWKVWGSVPSDLRKMEVGDTVEFAASVTKSDNDPAFGFFAKPTKGKLLKKKEAE